MSDHPTSDQPTSDHPSAGGFGLAPPGHPLPAGLALGRVRLQVADLDRSLEFYRRVLGLDVRGRASGVALLGAAGEPLVELRERPGVRPAPRGGRLGLYHFALLLPGRAALGRFVAHLAALGVPAGAADHLVSNSLYLRDPDGLGIEVYADRPAAEWQVDDGGELRMTTLPLDLDALVEEAGGEPWAGAPAGTRVGHLHLHVGDLARARAFYHRALGFRLTVWSYPGALFLAAPGYHHHLGLNVWATDKRPPDDDQAQLLDWEVRLPDGTSLAAVRAALEAAGEAVEASADGVTVRDPWGTALRLTAATPAG